jgi:hypothetical protein
MCANDQQLAAGKNNPGKNTIPEKPIQKERKKVLNIQMKKPTLRLQDFKPI